MKDKILPIKALLPPPKLPPPTIATPTNATPMANTVRISTFSLKMTNPPTNAMAGCSARINVELATVVCFNDSNHNPKWQAKKKPANIIAIHSLIFISKIVFRCLITIGDMMRHARNIRYMTITVEGASDNFTNIADREMQIIVITNKMLMVLCFNLVPPKVHLDD